MATFVARHVEHAGVIEIPAPLKRAFDFFTPHGERRWAPGWDPEYLYPQDGTPGEGLTFRTRADGELTLWLVTRYDPRRGQATYVRVTPGSRLGTVTVSCEPRGAALTAVRITYRLTGLTEEGNAALDRFTAAVFVEMLENWRAAVVALLERH